MPKPANGYIFFYSFYSKILDEEFPKLSSKEKAIKAGEIWKSSSNDLLFCTPIINELLNLLLHEWYNNQKYFLNITRKWMD
jgi:hypothetical protein